MDVEPENNPSEQEAIDELQRLAHLALEGLTLPSLSQIWDERAESVLPVESRSAMPDPMYRILLEQLPVVSFMARLEGISHEIYVSPQIEDLLGYSQQEWISNPILWYECLHEEDKARWNIEFARFLMMDEPFHAAYRFIARDGRVIWVHGDIKMIRDAQGRPIYLQGIGYDITRQREAEQKLLESLQEKEVLLKEIHHRVKNNLAVISSLFYLQSGYTQDESTRKILQESQDRVRSMALVHESLYCSENLAALDFSDYANTLGRQLVSTYSLPSSKIALITDLQTVRIPIDIAVPCGLILNEVITNALKHAFPDGQCGEIRLALHRIGEDACVLSVTDNGIGLPSDRAIEASSSLGLRLIRSLTRQIDGRFELLPASPGTEARLTMRCSSNSNKST